MFNSVNEQIEFEVSMYVRYCQLAANHDYDERWYRMAAHAVFCHIEEMRQTRRQTMLGSFVRSPIS